MIQSYTFLMCKGTDSMESHSAFAYLPTIWTLIYLLNYEFHTTRHIWQTWQHKGRATTQTRLRRVSSCCSLSRWNSSNNFLISWWYNSNWSVSVSCRMSQYLETQSRVWGGPVSPWAPDSAQSAAERSWNWYQVEETHLQISLHLLSDLPLHCRLPSCLIYSSFHLHSADCCPTFFIPLVVFDGLPGDDCSSLSLTLCKV